MWRWLLWLLALIAMVALYVLWTGPSQDPGPGLGVAQRYAEQLAGAVVQFHDSTGVWPKALDSLPRGVIVAANASIAEADRSQVAGGTLNGVGQCSASDGSDCSAYSRVYRYNISYHCCDWPVAGMMLPRERSCSDSLVPVLAVMPYRGGRYYWNWGLKKWQTSRTGEGMPEPQYWSFSAANDSIAWAAASQGLYARTTDGGRTCRMSRIPWHSSLQFAAVEAVTPDLVYLLAADVGGGPPVSIYQTTDAGATWQRQYRENGLEPVALRFADQDHGIAIAKPGSWSYNSETERRERFGLHNVVVLRTGNGGKDWEKVDTLPSMLPGEKALNRSLAVFGARHAWFGTHAKGDSTGRVFRTADGGRTWSAVSTPATPSDGIYQVAFRDTLNGVAIACGFQRKTFVMRTSDGGQSWTLALKTGDWGQYCYELAYVNGAPTPILTLRSGGHVRYSTDDGATWAVVGPALYRGLAPVQPWKMFVEQAGWAARWTGRLVPHP